MDYTQQASPPKSIDFNSLSQPVTVADKRAYDLHLTSTRVPTKPVLLIMPKVFKSLWIIATALVLLQIARGAHAENTIVLLMLLVGIGVFWALTIWHGRIAKERQAGLWRFARENNLIYSSSDMARGEQGILFSQTRGSSWTDIIAEPSGAYEIGKYAYVTGSGKHQTTHNWVYARVRLDRALPHMVLDAEVNNFFTFSNLPMTFKKDQTLSLEGNFNEIFTLYAPKTYERDALYIFTPDLMALLLDEVAEFDAEIIDNQLYFYAKRKTYEQPEYMQRMFIIIEKIGQKMAHRVKNYEDERAEAQVNNDATVGTIAPAGRRLKQGVPWLVVVGVVFLVLAQAWPYIITSVMNIWEP